MRGRVAEVNWRAVHIDTGNGTQIVPNASLAGSSFTNLSRPSGAHTVSVGTTFATDDPPNVVEALLDRVASDLTDLHPGSVPESSMTGPKAYTTTFQLRSPADTERVTATFLSWLWYASRRADLHLDGASGQLSTPELTASALRRFATTLHVREDEIEGLAGRTRIERYGAGEVVIPFGVIPEALLFITVGRMVVSDPVPGGGFEAVEQLGPGDYVGATAVTREATRVVVHARDEVTVLHVPIAVIDELIASRPASCSRGQRPHRRAPSPQRGSPAGAGQCAAGMTITGPPSDAPTGVETPPPSLGGAATPVPARRRRRYGIRPRLLLMLLATSVISALVAGYVGYRSGTTSLRDSAFARLTEVRESKSREVEQLFQSLQDSMVIYTRGRTVIEALEAFDTAFDELQASGPSADQERSLQAWYDDVFVPELERRGRFAPQDPVELPASPVARYLQAEYTAPFTTADEAILVDDAGDGSAWSAAHARFHDYFRELTLRFGYDDALLIDADGDVVYSAYKGADLGTNVLDGPYAGTGLGRVFEEALESNAVDFVAVGDYERYQPSFAVPTAFVASPIGIDGDIIGAFVVTLPIGVINSIMTADGDWNAHGLGDTGETYLAGPDLFMRSAARLVLEDPQTYARRAVAAGLEEDAATFAAEVRGTVLLQRVDTEAVERALRGETGTVVADEYLGDEALVAYAPVEAGGLRWVVIAKLDTSEAFEPTRQFAVRLALATGLIVLAVCVASWFLAQVFARPVRRLVAGVRAVAAGDLATRVDARSNDEFGDLGVAFNDMARGLQTKQELLDHQHAENERLLRSLMPDKVARRYREGAETIVEDHADVAVVAAEITGLEEHARGRMAGEGLAMLNEIVRGFDDAADRIGVERVSTVRSGYLATSGLAEQHDDRVSRAVEFAEAMVAIVEQVAARHGAGLGVRAVVGYGTVTSGLVGRSNLVFDAWGESVDQARRAAAVANEPGVYVTDAVREVLHGARTFERGDATTDGGEPAPVWRLVPADP